MFKIDKTIECIFYAAQKGMHANWISLCTPDFRAAVERGLNECGRLGAKSWIVDLTRDPGVPSQADLKWIETDTAQLIEANDVKALINVLGQSSIARMGARRWSRSASANGMLTYDCASLEDALEIAAEVASGKADRT